MYAAEVCFFFGGFGMPKSNTRAQTDTEDKEKMRMRIFEIKQFFFFSLQQNTRNV